MKHKFTNLCIGLLLSSTFSAHANDEKRWFEVEVLIFERKVDDINEQEHWNESDTPVFSKKYSDPFSLFLDKNNFKPIPSEFDTASSATVSTGEEAIAGIEEFDEAALELQFATANTDSPVIINEEELITFSDNTASAAIDIESDILADELTLESSAQIIVNTEPVIDGGLLLPEVQAPELEIVPAEELQLIQQLASLEQHANYKVLLHSAWRMPPTVKRRSTPIRIFAGQNFQTNFNADGTPIPQPEIKEQTSEAITGTSVVANTELISDTLAAPTLMADDSINPAEQIPAIVDIDNTVMLNDNDSIATATPESDLVALSQPPVWQLDGELLIYLEHYLYAKTNLFIRKETTREVPIALQNLDMNADNASSAISTVKEQDLLSLSSLKLDLDTKQDLTQEVENQTQDDIQVIEEVKQEPFLQSYPMKQLRVIRSGEIHYLDHPKFGMIIQIRKYEKPEEEELAVPSPLSVLTGLPATGSIPQEAPLSEMTTKTATSSTQETISSTATTVATIKPTSVEQ